MKRKVLFASLVTLLAVGLVAVGTWCCLGWMMNRQMAQGSVFQSQTWPRMLHLTAVQHQQIAPLEKKLKADLMPIDVELAQTEMELCRRIMSTEKVDRKAMGQLSMRISALQEQREERVIDHLAAVKGILNSRQQQTLFTTLMTDICRGCRQATGNKKDYCGLCKMR